MAEGAFSIQALNALGTPSIDDNAFVGFGIIIGIFLTVVECGLWLWMAWTALAGHGWARILSTVFFGIMCLMLVHYLIRSLPSAPAGVSVSLALEWLVGLAALILLWQRASSQFFTASRQARAMFRRASSSG